MFEALAEQDSVAGLLRALRTLDETEVLAVVFERALSAMAERRWKGSGVATRSRGHRS